MRLSLWALLAAVWSTSVQAQCLPYVDYSAEAHKPHSSGKHRIPSMRPVAYCRTFNSPNVESEIKRMSNVIKDPDLYALFRNTWPNTLDTTVRWRGFANGTDEELSFIITGDITAMWLRDSANQLRAYLSQLNADSSPDSLAGLWRGAINLQARYIIEAPYCNAFQAPEEAGIASYNNMGSDMVYPPYDTMKVFSCDYELDSLASFLSLSADYAEATGDYEFFGKYSWTKAVRAILKLANEMQIPTYDTDGTVLDSPFTFSVMTSFGGAPINGGRGSPIANDTGLIRSFFRPSDDACIFQFLVPANMYFATSLARAASIMRHLNKSPSLIQKLVSMSSQIRKGIADNAVIPTKKWGDVYAYEIDGYGSTNTMDDANVPNLVSIPYLGYLDPSALSPDNGDLNAKETYLNTRQKVLGLGNPYFASGVAIAGVGSPHTQPGHVWPMSLIMQAMTSEDEDEVAQCLKTLLTTTGGLGLMHESITTGDASDFSRSWFAWANGLFGQLIMDLEKRMPDVLKRTYQ